MFRRSRAGEVQDAVDAGSGRAADLGQETGPKGGGKGKWVLVIAAIAAGAAAVVWRRGTERPDPWATATTDHPAGTQPSDGTPSTVSDVPRVEMTDRSETASAAGSAPASEAEDIASRVADDVKDEVSDVRSAAPTKATTAKGTTTRATPRAKAKAATKDSATTSEATVEATGAEAAQADATAPSASDTKAT